MGAGSAGSTGNWVQVLGMMADACWEHWKLRGESTGSTGAGCRLLVEMGALGEECGKLGTGSHG